MLAMRSIGSDGARTHFYRLLDDVSAGEPLAITKRGKAVAMLVPIGPAASNADDVLDWMRAFRKRNVLGGISIRDLIDEGRR